MEEKNKGLNIASLVFLCLDIICLLGLILFVVFVTKRISLMYKDFHLPYITKVALLSHYIFIILALVLIIKEKSKKKLFTLLLNIVVFIMLVLGALPLLVYGTFLPMRHISKILESEGIGTGIGIMEASIIAKDVCKEEGWEWANINTKETDTYWEFTTNYNRLGTKASVRIDKKTGRVLDKHLISP